MDICIAQGNIYLFSVLKSVRVRYQLYKKPRIATVAMLLGVQGT